MENPFLKLTDVTDEDNVNLGIKHSWHDEYGWHLCHFNFQDDLHRCLKIGRYKHLRKKSETKQHYFITISFPPNQNLPKLLKSMEKIVSKKWIKDNTWYYSIEQRGENMEELGKGIHVHLLVLKNKRKSQVLRECASTLKLPNHFIDVRVGQTLASYNTRLNYIKGIKKDDYKLVRCELDKLFRSNNNLLDIYTNASQSPSNQTQLQTFQNPKETST